MTKWIIFIIIALFLMAFPYRVWQKKGLIILVPLLILLLAIFSLKATLKIILLSAFAFLLLLAYLWLTGET
jgi:hypothetical protein